MAATWPKTEKPAPTTLNPFILTAKLQQTTTKNRIGSCNCQGRFQTYPHNPRAVSTPAPVMSGTSLNFGDAVDATHPRPELQFTEKTIAKDLECAICLNPVNEARVACINQHLFCAHCLGSACREAQRCPTCRSDVSRDTVGDYGRAAPYIDTVVHNLEIVCPHGCEHKMKLKELKAHKEECLEVIETCNYCGEKVARKDINEHMKANAVKHLFIANSNTNELLSDTKESADRARNLMHQSYDKTGKVMIDWFRAIVADQRRIEKKMDLQHARVMDALSLIASSTASTESGKRKAAVLALSAKNPISTPPAKQQRGSPEAPGAPGPSSSGQGIMRTQMPPLRDSGLFDIRVDESGGIDRRNGGGPPSPTYSPTSPAYSPTSPQYDEA